MPIAKVKDLKICYESFGSASDPTLVLLMGLGCQMVLWAPEFCQALAARGYHVLRYDHRDLGHSSKVAHLGRVRLLPLAVRSRLGLPVSVPYTLRDMAGDLWGLLDALGIARAHVVGVSMGGMIAQHAAIMSPSRVMSLCLWMTSGHHRPLPPPKLQVLRSLFHRTTGSREGDIELGILRLRALSGGVIPFDEELTRRLVTESWERDRDPRGFIRQLAAIVAEKSRAKELSRLSVPTLVMHGGLDPMIPVSHGRELARLIPNARLRVFEDLGHDYPMALWPQLIEAIHQNAATVR